LICIAVRCETPRTPAWGELDGYASTRIDTYTPRIDTYTRTFRVHRHHHRARLAGGAPRPPRHRRRLHCDGLGSPHPSRLGSAVEETTAACRGCPIRHHRRHCRRRPTRSRRHGRRARHPSRWRWRTCEPRDPCAPFRAASMPCAPPRARERAASKVPSSRQWTGEQQIERHPTGSESMGSPTMQTLQEPILLSCFDGDRLSKGGGG
jgi:hypothetical protein